MSMTFDFCFNIQDWSLFSVETISKNEEFGENESLETSNSKNSESIHNGFSKDTDPLNTETSAMSGDTNQNNSIHLDSLPCSEEISFSESGKESIDPDSESSDQNEDDMPPLIDNESVMNEKEKESETKSNKNNSSEITDNKNPTSLEENINPDTIKENDVKDECLHENIEEKTVDDEDDKEEEEYLDILGNGSLKRKVNMEQRDSKNVEYRDGNVDYIFQQFDIEI